MRFLVSFSCLILLSSLKLANANSNPPQSGDLVKELKDTTFSFIIVGGGTAGLVIATRLSEIRENRVLLLEAGEEHFDDPLIMIPSKVGLVYGNPLYDWMYQTIPQVHSSNIRVNFTRGKMLGGCSAINAMIWDRASKVEYDMISELGNPGWDWDGLLPYFKKAENFTPPDPVFSRKWNLTFDPSTRGFSGPINTFFPRFITDAELPIEPAALSLGINILPEPMNGVTTGTWRAEASVDPITGTRTYSASGYFIPNRRRPNLKVITGAHATRINWATPKSASLTASSVTFSYQNQSYTARTSREVILSAGSIGSPQLLELSGIGEPGRLRATGVVPLVNLPGVGENMQDHIYLILSYKLKPGVSSLDEFFNNSTLLQEQLKLFAARPASGALTYTASGLTFLRIQDLFASSESLIQTLRTQLVDNPRRTGPTKQQKLQVDLVTSLNSVLTQGMHLTPDVADPSTAYVSFLVLLQQPFSRGSTHIYSANPLQGPLIDPNYFDVDFDLDVLVGAAQFVRDKISKSPPWADVIVDENYPGLNSSTPASLRSWVKSSIQSQSHTTGTCSMQPRKERGVVDPNLKVHGTSNVRVVDLSVMPQQFSGHPQALVYAIAEKAADIIKATG
ncbi:alcohol oxidase [Collybia nuda]|uniref:Alcohol oxidase n=1 Tax=Collybia nuda TaxID=64659 RepID=A0A9P6CJC3_9AGAR|nr:alcohol oxidase [Collybia nuda]